MEQLISMRQRIKAIESTKKITKAMRLIAMSAHSKMRNKKKDFEIYKKNFNKLVSLIKNKLPNISTESKNQTNKSLFIIIGSQKGLCGTYNTKLIKYFESYNKEIKYDLISVGKYISNYFKKQKINIKESFDNFSQTNFASVSHALTSIILRDIDEYQEVILFSNYPKSFFLQVPQTVTLIPFEKLSTDNSHQYEKDYIFEQDVQVISNTIKELMLIIKIQNHLIESLISEQAARFLSMDAATKNADNLLNKMKLDYNKLRQAIITRELTELSTSLQ